MPKYYVTTTPTLHTSTTSIPPPSNEWSYWSASFSSPPEPDDAKGSTSGPTRTARAIRQRAAGDTRRR